MPSAPEDPANQPRSAYSDPTLLFTASIYETAFEYLTTFRLFFCIEQISTLTFLIPFFFGTPAFNNPNLNVLGLDLPGIPILSSPHLLLYMN